MAPDSKKRPFDAVFSLILYSLAVVMACGLSVMIALSIMTVTSSFHLACLVTGFVGVFFPSFIVPRPSRWFCALFLLVLGVGFYYVGFIRGTDTQDPELRQALPSSAILPLIGGGVLALFIHWRMSRREKASETTPPAVGD